MTIVFVDDWDTPASVADADECEHTFATRDDVECRKCGAELIYGGDP